MKNDINNESLNISKKTNEISNEKINSNRKSMIMLNDLLKITINELTSNIENFNKINKPITGIKEDYDINEVKKFLDIKNSENEVKLLSYNNDIPFSDKDSVNYNNREMKKLITSINGILKKYYGKLCIQPRHSSTICDVYLLLTISKSRYVIKNEHALLREENFVITEEYIKAELNWMKLLEGSEALENMYKVPSQKGKNFVGKDSSDEDEGIHGLKKIIKNIYGMSDEDFINGKFSTYFTKALVRGIGLITVSASAGGLAYATKKHKLNKNMDSDNISKEDMDKQKEKNKKKALTKAAIVASLTLMIGFVTNKALKSSMRVAQREKLKDFYDNKLIYINDKIDKCESSEEKYELNKVKSKLIKDKEKIKIWSTKSTEE